MTRSQTPRHDHDYYEILNLPFTSPPTAISKQQLKIAYHKALLKHHPDKAKATLIAAAATPAPTHDAKTAVSQRPSSSANRTADASQTFTIDEITAAYRTLSDPALRAEYDRVRRLERGPAGEGEKRFHTGLEVVDLEDLVCEETGDGEGLLCWYRGCRCGDERGFMVTELDLEKEAEHGEVVIGCRGCSLWMKVLFVMEEGDG
ncbi:Diphthamide biosynthesis protein 4 [Aspergillus turcosus]|uniref:Diphthamide biosynthesis protein 4 n=1 Tax=Aspergillus turcosus TaxID=1245748 RepID=A0A3R7F3F9_9EURO|nr:Diphthamide biosynthesis protein 4 [Aspergillus turcosus]